MKVIALLILFIILGLMAVFTPLLLGLIGFVLLIIWCVKTLAKP